MEATVTKHTLTNGLLIILKEIHTAPIISQWVWYRVGSRNELPGNTGISHWVEHMQFKGTEEFPNNVLDKMISREGGNWNAFTYLDWTTYFETMPADKIDLALRLEADRMQNSLFAPHEVNAERTVIISERQGSENEPLFRLTEAMHKAAFSIHPYRHEVIGEMDDLRSMQREDLYQHYRTYYVPNNAVLAVAGDFDPQGMLTRLQELYENVPRGDEPPRQEQVEPAQTEEQPVRVEGPGETTYVKVFWHVPPAAHEDIWALTVMGSLLTGPSSPNIIGGGISNKTSRLYQALVDKELGVSVGGGLYSTIDPYLYTATIVVRPDRSAEQVVAALDAEIQRLQDSPPSQEDVSRAVKQARALFAYGTESITNQAAWLGYAEMFADYEWFEQYLEKLSTVTASDVQRVARNYMRRENRTLGFYLPTGNNG
ncbi:MAG: pitrilysin family protein [Chloroflexota bacterium]|nr:pitrilysin family protein [Chloroflexota bacterium]